MLAVTFPDMLAFVGGLAKDLPAGTKESSKKRDKCLSQLSVPLPRPVQSHPV